jgi:mannose-6-phosphate isomerase-like protein (cupin superfamily)
VFEIVRMGALELRVLQGKHKTGSSPDLFEMTLMPNTQMPVPHYHRDWDETVYGSTGKTSWTVASEEKDVAPGQSIFIPRGLVHRFNNRTSEPARFLFVLTPDVLGPEYVREMGSLIEGGAPDPTKLKETMLRHGLVPATSE